MSCDNIKLPILEHLILKLARLCPFLFLPFFPEHCRGSEYLELDHGFQQSHGQLLRNVQMPLVNQAHRRTASHRRGPVVIGVSQVLMPRHVKTPSCRWAPQSSLDGHKLCVCCVFRQKEWSHIHPVHYERS